MRSANDGWIVGNMLGPDGGGPREVLHYDGHAWTPVSDPTFTNITPLTLTGTANGQVWISGVDYSVSVGDGFDGNNHAALLSIGFRRTAARHVQDRRSTNTGRTRCG